MSRENNELWLWVDDNPTKEGYLYNGARERQICFVQYKLVPLLATGLPPLFINSDNHDNIPKVVGSHVSKSVKLPVYKLVRPDIGLEIVLRDNFYNWKMSVISDNPIYANFDGLFYTDPPSDPEYTGNCLSPVYFEGFPADLIFGYYDDSSDKKKWSAEIWDDERLYATIFLILRAIGHMPPLKRGTRSDK